MLASAGGKNAYKCFVFQKFCDQHFRGQDHMGIKSRQRRHVDPTVGGGGADLLCTPIPTGKQCVGNVLGKTCGDTVSNFGLKTPELPHLFFSHPHHFIL